MKSKRYIEASVRTALRRKMVMVGGPRQVGKTTFALGFLGPKADTEHPAYLNWDNPAVRPLLVEGRIPEHQPLLLLDEIHKYAKWRNLVKGLFDAHRSRLSILVTGSARLDYYRKGGDSLQGRYHYYRLHPFSLLELDAHGKKESLESLLRFGGFPEPLFSASERDWRRWQREHRERVLKEDLRDLERVREISMIELLLTHLPACVGSPLSVASLGRLLQVAPATVDNWIAMLERLYVCFRIAPYGSAKIRAVRKEKKLYFWDWSQVPEGDTRFENLVACQLLKYCHYLEDTEGYTMELRYLRDTDKREVDFVVLRDGRPEFAVECKTGERTISTSAAYFKERTSIPKFYQAHLGTQDNLHAKTGIRILPFSRFCQELRLP